MLKRKITAEFEKWRDTKSDKRKKALLVYGARQVGKSYAIRDFALRNYASYIEINLFENKQAKNALLDAQNANEFISRITILSGKQIVNDDTLVFIDEIQEAPELMTMLKFLVDDGRCSWIFSGSMLGTEFKGIRSYPVGYVHELYMKPMDWEEFCWAIDISDEAFKTIQECCFAEKPVPEYLHNIMMPNFRSYLVVGGMPEVVAKFIETSGDFSAVRSIQAELNKQYRRDISKYAGKRSLQVQSIFDQLPVQLEGDSQRFVLNSIDPDARFEKYQRDFVWLQNAGVALKTELVNEPKSPLLKTANISKFKLYQSDTGMLLARYPLGVAQSAYLDNNEFNLGGIYENLIAQELTAHDFKLYYYQTNKRGEVDFVIEDSRGEVVPIEVKSGRYYHAHAALDNILETPAYKISKSVVFSKGNIERKGKVLYLPFYAIFALSNYISAGVDGDFKIETVRV